RDVAGALERTAYRTDRSKSKCLRHEFVPAIRLPNCRSVMVRHLPRPYSQEHTETNGVLTIVRIQHAGFRIDAEVRSQSHLPVLVLHQVAHTAERIRTDSEAIVSDWAAALGKQLVLIDQFHSRECVILLREVQRR